MKLQVCVADRDGICGQTTGPYTMTSVTIQNRREFAENPDRG
ncbi:hypothetical protein YT1_5032 [Rhodococcus ruber]|nr:hypothetical protein YT1_5032 [Rhodococcus ruber]